MKRVLSTLSDKWPEFLLEVIVITAGIIGAFALNNWNDDRLERKLERTYLRSLQRELINDLESLDSLTFVRSNSSEVAQRILKTNQSKGSLDWQLQFTQDLLSVLLWLQHTPNDNTFQELRSSGNLSIFQNEKIKSGLLNLEALNNEVTEIRDHMRRDFDMYLYDELFELDQFDLIDYDHIIATREITFVNNYDPEELEILRKQIDQILENKKIRNGFKLLIFNNSLLLNYYDKMRTEIDMIQTEIQTQIQ